MRIIILCIHVIHMCDEKVKKKHICVCVSDEGVRNQLIMMKFFAFNVDIDYVREQFNVLQ